MSKTFKDFIVEDLDVFFNVNELASEHTLEGEVLTLFIIDSNSDNRLNGIPRDQMYASQEVFKQYKTIYVKASDFYIPKVDSVIELDGEEYYVEEAADENGVIRIVVSANES